MALSRQMITSVLRKQPLLSTVRDISLLTCSVFTETHRLSLKKIFGIDFSIIFWYVRPDRNVVFYRSDAEYKLFSKKTGERCMREPKFVQHITRTLVAMTDEIDTFLRTHKTVRELAQDWGRFYHLYRDFFAYHQVVYWASEYVADVKASQRRKRVLDALHAAYKYNEQAVPAVEWYFAKLGIGYSTFTEVAAQKHVPRRARRSSLFVGKRSYILTASDADRMHKAITVAEARAIINVREIRGLAASPGVVRGKARVITNLRELATCKIGEILVTTQTRPQYNAVMKHVAAIVTDEGGLLCHASMLAREFHIPCIVGTKNATKVLKTGDMVEVDATKGMVRKL